MRTLIAAVVLGAAVCGAACNRTPQADIEKLPVGSEVQVTREDGGLVEGKLSAKDEATLHVDTGRTTRQVPREQVVDARPRPTAAAGAAEAPLPPAARFREVTVPASTELAIKLRTAVSSERSKVEDTVRAELAEPLVVDGHVVLPAGSVIRGEVTEATPSSKVKGRASLGIRFRTVTANGQDYPIDARFERLAPSTTRKDIEKIGIPAAGGAVIGAIIGGKKGAAIGAAAGGGAGAAVVMTTAGDPVELADGAVLSLMMGRSIDARVDLNR